MSGPKSSHLNNDGESGSRAWRSGPSTGRLEHPYSDQFTNEWAWRFEAAFGRLASATQSSTDFGQRIVAMWEGLAGHKQEMADAWAVFVARKVAELKPDSELERRSRQPERPMAPFMRVLNPGFEQPATPAGWITEPIGQWEGYEAEVVYDPGRHEVLYTRSEGAPGLTDALPDDGWELCSADRSRDFWVRDRVGPAHDIDLGSDSNGELSHQRGHVAARTSAALERMEQAAVTEHRPPALGTP